MAQNQNHRENMAHSDELNPRKLLANYGGLTIGIDKNDISTSLNEIVKGVGFYLEILRPQDEKFLEKFNSARKEILKKIILLAQKNGGNILEANIDTNGIFHIHFENGEKQTLNIIEEWKRLTISEQEQKIQQSTREKEKKLQDEVAKEAFFGGSVVAEYISAPSLVVGTAGVMILGGLTKWAIDLKKDGLYAVQSITVVNEAGQKRRITFKKPPVGTKAEIAQSMEKIVETAGYRLDTTRKKVFSKTFVAVNSSRERLEKMTYQDYQNSPEWKKRPLTEEQFEKSKKFFLSETADVSKNLQNWQLTAVKARSNLSKLGASSLGFLGWSLFFYDFKQQQTPSNFLWAFAEEGSGLLLAKAGAKLPVPPLLKPLTAIAGGLAGALGANWIKNQLEPVRKKWQYFQDSNYSEGRNYFGEFTGLWVPEGWDLLNNYVFGKPRDIGIDRMEFSIWNKRLWVLPEFNLVQRSVSMGTNPAEWMSQATFRDVADWNKEVDNYKIRLTEVVYAELWKYFRNKWVYADKKAISEAGSKEQLFRTEMNTILLGGNSGVVFNREIERILDFLNAQLKTLSIDKIPNTDINNEILYRTEAMKIDSFFVKNQLNYYDDRMYHMSEFSVQIKTLYPYVSGWVQKYLEGLFDRMQDNKPLFETNDERLMYESVINNNNKISVQWVEMTVGNWFAIILETMAQHKMQHEFLTNLNNGHKQGISRHWIPHALRGK